ncbi:centromere-associated protein E isoform X7 [Homo sapiens]|uniref:centromere-associated protein E isoform X7 n=1 Tax=Homo sapiens TaxID=9606 RepID=UPI0000E090F8|nr:centromere-associated protein E isoform X7 [Homo sapiens]XP_054204759.1 centromere-associated protein E isoform X7 [Homo sapiens]|eukprot:XP_011529850.1 centromere-associated protein E isoform X5 [Homo sapiens]
MAEEGAVAVCVRVRPLNSREESLGETAQVYWKTDNNVIYQVDGSKSFNFDRVFHGNETTKNVYEEIAAPIIDSAIQGYNGTIFAYGQTASGKTYTMMGSEDHLGVIPRAIHDIFQKIKKFPDREFLLRVSYMEIYNETITDLLCGTQKMKPLIIREDVNRNVYVADLTEEVVYTSEMALKWITKGEKSRHYGETKMNQRSSRSHTIFRMILESREKGEPSNCEGSVKVSHLNLVDLAGSERAAQTGAAGVRLKEGCNINRSLFILGQVIKKLSDGQVGGFINYRDSKLTRILQNSLGGNAKTRIICTITPVSFDETLTALQFASTAKYMKNTPYVNEVSTDEALLKRYRKEIMDLKKQLEEVSLETRAQAMEKDQLAQLLEEKDLLQKVQNEKIENLTRMLVTSSSLTLQQELKAKRKRRVTWCLGKINKMKNSNYADQFNIPTNITTKTHKLSINLLREIDESVCSESDVFSNTLDTLSEIEWNPATKLLNQENIESELNSLRADYDNLVLDYEQLRTEKEEMELKLKEKNDLDEFEALERKTKKDQEMQLIHEISNLKNLVKHAEVYNQDLENELSSKVELLREKEDQIKKLQEYIDSQKLENIKMDLSYSLESIEDPKQMKQTLFDAETVALDAKRESAFLRSENLELKEKMKELATTYKQMENDIQLYQSQLEAKKKMQVDLEKELQSAFNEITKLTSLIDGKVPKDLLCNLELEGKITDLQKELNKEVEENEALREEVILLSELKSLPSEVERLRKEIQDKSEELHIITSEKDKLFSEVVHKESRVQGLLEEIGKTKDDLATTQSNYKSTDQEFQNFKTLHMDFEQKYKMVLEENERMNQEIVNLSKEAQKFDSSLGALKTELSYKTQELQEKTREVQERLNEMEQLKEQLENRDSTLQTVEREKTLITEKLQQTLEEVKTLTQEKDDLKQLQESLQIERDQLKSDIHDTVNMNIDTQEQLRNALESLKQHQETINTLKSKISEEVSRNLHMEENTGETKDEFQQKMVGIDKKQDLEAKNTQTLTADVKDNEIIEQQRKIFSLIQEKNELQQMLESVIAEKEQLKTDLKENIEMTIENQEELRLLGDELKKQQEIVAQEKNHAIKKEGELSRTCDRLAEVEEKLKEKSQQLQEKQQQLLNVQEEMSEMQKKINEIENLKNELKNKELTLEHMETERLELAQKLNENYEEVKSITKERKVLKELQKSFETERDHLRGYIREIEATGLQTKEELKIAHIHLKEHQETIDELRRSVSEKTAQIINTQDLEKSHTKLQEEIPVLHEEQELLPNVKEVSETQETMNELELLTEQSTTKDSTTLARIEMERLRLNEKFQESQEEIKSLTKERDNLKTIKEALEVKHDQLKEHIRETLAKIQESQSKQEQSLNMKEKDNETTKIVSEMEQFKPKDSALLRIEIEMLGLSKRLQESHDEMKSVAKEKDDLQRLQEVLQSESDQLKENIKEIVAKHLETEEELKVAHCCLKEQEETINELRVNLSEKETEISTIQKQLEAINDKLQNKIQEIYEKEEQFNIKQISEVQEKVNELKQFKEHRKAKDSALQSIESKMLELTNRLQESQEEIQIMIKEKEEMKRVQEALQIERDQLKENTKEIVAKMKESQEKEYQFLKMTAVNETQEKMCEIEHLKEQFETQKLNLENIETENIRLTQILHENLEEMRSVTKERDDLRSVEETLKVERDQLKENLRETITRDLEKQEELKIVHMHLKEHQETIDKLRGIVSEKTNEISNMQKDLEHSNDALKAQDLKIQEELRIAHMHLKEQQETIDKLRGIVSEKTDKLSNMQKDLENSNAKLQEKIQELKANEHQLITLKKDVNETQKKVSEMEQLKKQIKDQSLTLSKLEIENLNLAQKLHENLEEMKSVMKERDNLRRVEETLKLERDQLKESLQETKARDLEIQQELKTARMLSKEHKETVDKLREKISEKTIQISDIQKDLDKSKDELQKKDRQNHQVKPEKRLLSDGQQHLTESLREKCSRIKELLKRYSEMDDHYECLNRLSLDLEKEIEFQKELSMRVKANLSLPYLQTKHIEKLFTANQRCSMEFHRIMKKLKYVLSYVTKIKEEQHESINKFEMDFIDEVEKQKELLIKIQHLQQDCDVPSRELRDLKLNQNMDLHIEEILKDFSESEFPSIKTEFQQVLSNRKEMTQFLEEWLNTRFDIEKLKNGIQKENDRICQVNNFFNNRIIAIMNESTEFEERSATISKEWEQDLKSLKEKNEKLFKNYQTLKTSLASGAQVNPTTQDNKNPHVTSRATQLTTEKIRELENSLHEAKESAMHKESKIIKMQKELEVTNDIIAKLQAKVHESNKCLEKTKETIQVLQDKVALGAKPYKEEIEDLKMKLVKIDLEKMKNAKEFEKEISATKATVEYQKEVIRLLRENLRRSQQAQDTSVISEHTDPQPSNKPLTCGGGSGIVQNTKALILKSEHIRLEKEISKLKQQNEQLIKQKNELLSNNQHLSNEVKTWKERTLKREAHKQVTCENSPKSPKVTGTASKKKQITPSQCKERNLQDPVPKESPKSCFFDSRSKSLPSPHPVRYFDNSSLGLCPEVQNAGAESVDSQPGPWHASSGKDVPECKTQ